MPTTSEKKPRRLNVISEARYSTPVIKLGETSLSVSDAKAGQAQAYQQYNPMNLAADLAAANLSACPCASTCIE
jgi:energy-converting hydrogenase Eha subunit A